MIKQLSVFIQNKIGSLSGVTSVLKANNINLRAISSYDTPDFTILRMVVDQPDKAKDLLADSGYGVNITCIVAVELEDKPGELHGMLEVVAKACIGVNYIYSIVRRNGGAPLIVLNTDKLEKTADVLKDKGYIVISQEDL